MHVRKLTNYVILYIYKKEIFVYLQYVECHVDSSRLIRSLRKPPCDISTYNLDRIICKESLEGYVESRFTYNFLMYAVLRNEAALMFYVQKNK